MSITVVSETALCNAANFFGYFLSKTEQSSYRRIHDLQKKDWLAGRIALKHSAFWAYPTLPPSFADIIVHNKESGEPYIRDNELFRCSIAHSEGWGVAAVAPYRIGVDIEKIKPRKNDLTSYILHDFEQSVFQRIGLRDQNVLMCAWTIKEAIMKALGTGFALSPKNIHIIEISEKVTTAKVINVDVKYTQWRVYTIKSDGFYISIAYPHQFYEQPTINWIDTSFIQTAAASSFT